MPIFIGNEEIQSLDVGSQTIREVYVGTTRVFPTVDPIRNEYSVWVDSGSSFGGQVSTREQYTAWTPTSAPITQRNINQTRFRNLITTTRGLRQRQVRTCTASGGCDGPFERTIFATPSETTVTNPIAGTTESRTISNPDYSPVAIARWLYVNSGASSGGTLASSREGAFGEWQGAADITFTSGTPTEASCDPDNATCTISRSRIITDTYFNASQSQTGHCTVTVAGSGTPRCSSPDGAVGDTDTRTTNVSRVEARTDTQTVTVPNRDENNLVEFTRDSIIVQSCSVSNQGIPTIVTNFGTATGINVPQNTIQSARSVSVTYDVRITSIPGGFFSDTPPPFVFRNFIAICIQAAAPAVTIPVFTNDSAILSHPDGRRENVRDGETIVVNGGFRDTYSISAPRANVAVTTASGSNGSGSFSISPADREHSFEARIGTNVATYSFTVVSNI